MSDLFIHPTAIVESDSIGAGSRIWAFTHVLEGASIGENCNVGDHCFIESDATIGRDVTIKNGNAIWQGVTLEDGVFVAPGVVFTNDLHPRSPRLEAARSRYVTSDWLLRTRVGRGATLGAGAVILPGLTIGEFAFVGAGAVVTKDVPAFAVVLGCPARQSGWVCRCGQQLRAASGDDAVRCPACAAVFRVTAHAVVPWTDSERTPAEKGDGSCPPSAARGKGT